MRNHKFAYKYRRHMLARQRDELRKTRRVNRRNAGYVRQRPSVRNFHSNNVRTLKAPINFVLHENPAEFLTFINDFRERGNGEVEIIIDFEETIKISHGAIAMFASVVYFHKKSNIVVRAKYPQDVIVKRLILESGLFNHHNGKIEQNGKFGNIILTKGKNLVEPQSSALIVERCMKVLTGQESRFPPLQRMVIEMMANSVNHAFGGSEMASWLLAVDHSSSDRVVRMVFVDIGKGIAETIFKKLSERISEGVNNFFGGFMEISHQKNLIFIKEAFDGSRKSSTLLPHRGKGLPTIFRTYRDNKILNLHVVTNNVYWDFSNPEPTLLDVSFSGTYYYWELNETCIS